MTPGRRLALNGVVMSAGSVVGGLLLLLVFVVAARYLGVEAFGNFVLVLTVTSLIQLFGDGGIVNITVRDIARSPDRQGEILAKNTGVVWAVSAPLVLLLLLVAGFAVRTMELRVLVYLMGAATVCALHASLLSAVARAHEQMALLAALGVLHKALLAVLVIGAAWGDRGLAGVAGAHLAANLVHCLALYGFIRLRYTRPRVSLDLEQVGYLLKESLPLGAGVLLRRMNIHVCTLLLGVLVSTSAVGLYNSGYRFLQMIEVGSLTISGVLLPALAKTHGPDLAAFNRLFSSTVRVLLLVSAPTAGFLCMVGDELIVYVYGVDYTPAGVVLRLLGASLIALVPGALLHAAFTASQRQPLFMRLSALGVVVNATASLVLIPLTESFGAALATLATEAVTLVVGVLWLTRAGIEARYFDSLLRALVPTILAVLVTTALRGLLFSGLHGASALLLVSLLYIASYGFFVVALGSVRMEELRALLGRSTTQPRPMEQV